jgi:hypothetical protein
MIFAKHTCEMCGLKTAAHNRDVRFRLPDPVLESNDELNAVLTKEWPHEILAALP